MKKLVFVALLMWGSQVVHAQNSPAQQLADKIAQRMQDSLSLSPGQRQSVYQINMQLSSEKSTARQQIANRDSLALRLQRIENTRDTLYHPVLTSQQYSAYKNKKRQLVSNN